MSGGERQDAGGGSRGMERRPIGARRWGFVVWMAERLVAAGIGPNGVSIGGMVFGAASGAALGLTGRMESGGIGERMMWLVGAVCIVVRSGANVLDGLVAERSGRVTAVGRLYNEAPDRVSDGAMLVGLGYATGSWVLGGWIAALAALAVAYVRAAVAAVGAPQDYGGPMAKPHRMYLVVVTAVAMAVMPAGWREWGVWEMVDGPARAALWVVIGGCMWTAWMRLLRGARYLKETEGR